MNEIEDLWMNAHAMAAMDSQVDLLGNSHDTWAVIQTLKYVEPVLKVYGMDLTLKTPTREEIVQYLTTEGREHEIEYLMEDY